jgi:hypothetical protein
VVGVHVLLAREDGDGVMISSVTARRIALEPESPA